MMEVHDWSLGEDRVNELFVELGELGLNRFRAKLISAHFKSTAKS
jgi:hypothetical protein